MEKHLTTIDIRSRRPRTTRHEADEFLYQARNPRRPAAQADDGRRVPSPRPSPEALRFMAALEGMVRFGLPHIDDGQLPTVRIDIADATTGAAAGTLTLPTQLVDLLTMAVAAVGEQYRTTPVTPKTPATPALRLVTAGGTR